MPIRALNDDFAAWKLARDELAVLEKELAQALLRHARDAQPYPTGIADAVARKRREVDHLADVALAPHALGH